MDQYYIQRSSKVAGPYNVAQVVTAFQNGRLVASDAVGVSQTGPWESMQDFCLRHTQHHQGNDTSPLTPEVTPVTVVAPDPLAAQVTSAPGSAGTDAEMVEGSNPYAAPMAMNSPPAMPLQAAAGDSTGGLIPYKNPQALIAYYLGLFSILPFLGLPMGIAAFIFGIKGLRARKKNKAIKGSAHAAIGIGCGGFCSLLWSAAIVLVLVDWWLNR